MKEKTDLHMHLSMTISALSLIEYLAAVLNNIITIACIAHLGKRGFIVFRIKNLLKFCKFSWQKKIKHINMQT